MSEQTIRLRQFYSQGNDEGGLDFGWRMTPYTVTFTPASTRPKAAPMSTEQMAYLLAATRLDVTADERARWMP